MNPACIETFLAEAGWHDADRIALSGDASSRRYWRLVRGRNSAILAHSPGPDGPAEAQRFATIGAWLGEQGYSAPSVIAAKIDAGLLLLEDLGDAVFGRMVDADPKLERVLYGATVALLVDLRSRRPPESVALLDGPGLAQLVAVLDDWYLLATAPSGVGAGAAIGAEISRIYTGLNDLPPALSMRDFHAGNLIWLPDRVGLRQVGLLDFQDAVATHPIYDLVSLLQDARRDVSEETSATAIDLYRQGLALPLDQFDTLYALIGAQRSLRILGVFARLAMLHGRREYLVHVPRVWGHITRNLAAPQLAPLARLVSSTLPEPTPEQVAKLVPK